MWMWHYKEEERDQSDEEEASEKKSQYLEQSCLAR